MGWSCESSYLSSEGQLRYWLVTSQGAVAQLGERLICIQEVVGSNPISSTSKATKLRASVLRVSILYMGETPFSAGLGSAAEGGSGL